MKSINCKRILIRVEGKTMLFDAPLQMKFHEASRMGRDYDMTQIFTGTLVEADPFHAVTLVANHDTQPFASPRSTGRTVGLNRWHML